MTRHLPGFGGVATLDELEVADAVALTRRLAEDLEREARAWRKAPGAR